MKPAPALRESVYTDHFGLDCEPFRVTPDPKFFFAGPDYRLMAASLLAALGEPDGICLLSGSSGSGKTMLLRQVVHALNPQVPAALIWSSNLEYPDFFASVSGQLGGDLAEGLAPNPGQVIEASARRAFTQGRHPVLVVDEAHSLPDSVIRLLPRLTQLQFEGRQALAIVLAVEEGHRGRLLKRLGVEHLGLELVVPPMDADQVRSYVAHRLRVAGYRGPGLFTAQALQALAQVAGGVPRLVNMVAGKALFVAYLGNEARVEADLIDEVAAELWRAAGAEPGTPTESTLPDLYPGAGRASSTAGSESYPDPEQAVVPSRVVVTSPAEQRYVDLRAALSDQGPRGRDRVGETGGPRRTLRPLSPLSLVLLLLSLAVATLVATETGRGWIKQMGTPVVEHLESLINWTIARREPVVTQALPPLRRTPAPEAPVQASSAAPTPKPAETGPQGEVRRRQLAPAPAPALNDGLVAGGSGRGVEITPAVPLEPSIEPELDLSMVGQEIERTRMVRALMSLAAEYLEAGRFTEPPGANAYQSYLDVLELDPANSEALGAIDALRARLERYARIAEGLGDWDGAIRHYRSVVAIAPESKSAREALERAQRLRAANR